MADRSPLEIVRLWEDGVITMEEARELLGFVSCMAYSDLIDLRAAWRGYP